MGFSGLMSFAEKLVGKSRWVDGIYHRIWAVRVLLECFLVVIVITTTINKSHRTHGRRRPSHQPYTFYVRSSKPQEHVRVFHNYRQIRRIVQTVQRLEQELNLGHLLISQEP